MLHEIGGWHVRALGYLRIWTCTLEVLELVEQELSNHHLIALWVFSSIFYYASWNYIMDFYIYLSQQCMGS